MASSHIPNMKFPFISFIFLKYPELSLVGGAITILKNMSSSMGRMTSHI